MTYRSAILGCGPRAEGHALVYRDLSEMKLVAACDRDQERRESFAQDFAISRLYDDLQTMLEKERPDVLHIVTQPNFRVVPIELAAKAGVKAVIVEKPVVLLPSEARALAQIAQQTGIKIVVNTQRRYFASVRQFNEVIASGKLGEMVFIRCITKGNMLSMGPHLMDLLLMFLGDVAPTQVWACAYGAEDFQGTHSSPASIMANYTFPDSIQVLFESSKDAVGTPGEDQFWQHCELDLWGTQGWGWWTQNRDWGYQTAGMSQPITGDTDWMTDEPPGQRDFTRAVATWLDDDSQPHENQLENALRGFDALMAAAKSALVGRRLDLPTQVTDEDFRALEKLLRQREGAG